MSVNTDVGHLARQLFSGLAELTPECDAIPDVARDWEVREAGRQYIFHLRDDVYWRDGVPVAADDFEFAWRRVLDPATASPAASMLYDVKNARAFHEGRVADARQLGVSAIDSRTLLVALEGPTSYFFNLLACTATFPVPRHAVQARGQAWAQPRYIVSNGAFLIHSFVVGDAMVLALNPRYHGLRSGNVERVEYRFLSNWSSAREMYEADQLDTIGVFGLASTHEEQQTLQRFAADCVSERLLQTYYLAFVASQPPFDDARVRRAFAMAVDRRKLASVAPTTAVPATGGFVPPGMPGYMPGIALPYDPEHARALLAEAGYPKGRGLPVLELQIGARATDWAGNLQAQWARELGADTRWTIPESPLQSLERRWRTSSPHMFLTGWFADYPDPDNFLRIALAAVPTGWRHEAYQGLLDGARRCMDQTERLRLYRQADKILIEDAVVVPLWHNSEYRLLKPWVRMRLDPLSQPQYKDVIIEPH